MTLVTKKGDRGMTGIGGQQVPKNHPRLEACGDLDELNAAAGLLIAALPREWQREQDTLIHIQDDIFHIGSWIAAPENPQPFLQQADWNSRTALLEQQIQRMETDLPDLKQFIRPGGHVSANWAHLARTICRRAERRLAGLNAPDSDNPDLPGILQYINRLSDYLFLLARTCNFKTGTPETFLNRRR